MKVTLAVPATPTLRLSTATPPFTTWNDANVAPTSPPTTTHQKPVLFEYGVDGSGETYSYGPLLYCGPLGEGVGEDSESRSDDTRCRQLVIVDHRDDADYDCCESEHASEKASTPVRRWSCHAISVRRVRLKGCLPHLRRLLSSGGS